jgi:hypothetical protein
MRAKSVGLVRSRPTSTWALEGKTPEQKFYSILHAEDRKADGLATEGR